MLVLTDNGLTATGVILAIPLPSDPGGASGPESILLVKEYVVERLFDGRQCCKFVLRHQAGDELAHALYPCCPAYGQGGVCGVAGYDRPQDAGTRRCAFHVVVDDPVDDVWDKARDWELRMVPEIDRRGNAIPGRFVEAACYQPRESVSCETDPARRLSSDSGTRQ
jgi:hypothetical protein